MLTEFGVGKKKIKWVFWQNAIPVNHRLKLSVKCYIQTTYLINVFKILREVHEFCSKSPSHIHQFQELAMVLYEENVTSVPTSRVEGLSWKIGLQEIILRLPSVGHSKNNEKCKICCMGHVFKHISNHLSNLSLTIQSNDIDMLYALTDLKQL
ncbi:hypothetical protein PR048_005292 [Dryococelus australis]|uniref:Uncharacterized protein n=1 Tax=Dryococelus australis TaxID=614101 RepID=A0ABQ9I7U7_9NEOP|nr:hypothetical protein PR048_005292 [Dryococelus australis]